MKKTKGQLEAEISTAITQFEKDHLGRGPQETKAIIIQDMILVRLKGVLTPAETQLAKSMEGAKLIKEIRIQLIESSRKMLEEIIEKKCAVHVISLHTDISSKTGERVFLFVLDQNLERKYF